MRYLTAAQMREADRRCIEEVGIPGAVLMNNAGVAVFNEIDDGPVGIVCGKGNNGGDGFVVARLCLLRGFQTHVVLLADPESVRGDAATFLRAYTALGGTTHIVRREQDIADAFAVFNECHTMVDAILGTGATGELRGIIRTAIESWPPARTIAVDIPSGLHCDTGEPLGACIRADITVTFQSPKAGFQNPAAASFLGTVIVADIGIPPVCVPEND